MIFTDKPNFDAAEYKARELRLMQDDSSLALDVLKMKFDKQIVIDTYQHYSEVTGIPLEKMSVDRCLNDGYMVPRKAPFLVLYNKKCTIKEHLNWTLAHEIGHIYLRHLCDGPKEEIEAHWFAAELLSPEPLINYMVRLNKIDFSSDSIRKVFNLSHEASVKRYKSLKNKSDCSPYWQDELESKYYHTIQSYGHNSNGAQKEFVTVRQLLAAAGFEIR